MIEIAIIYTLYCICVAVIGGEIAVKLLGMPRKRGARSPRHAKPVKPESQDGSMAEVPYAGTQTGYTRNGQIAEAPRSPLPRHCPEHTWTHRKVGQESILDSNNCDICTKKLFSKNSPQKPTQNQLGPPSGKGLEAPGGIKMGVPTAENHDLKSPTPIFKRLKYIFKELKYTNKDLKCKSQEPDANLTQIGRKQDANRTQKTSISANDLPWLCEACSGAYGMSRIVPPERCENCKVVPMKSVATKKKNKPPRLQVVSTKESRKKKFWHDILQKMSAKSRRGRVPARELRKPPRKSAAKPRLVAPSREVQIENACMKVQLETKRQLQKAVEYRIEQLRRDLSSKKTLTKVVSKDTIEQMKFRVQELESLRSFIKNSVLYRKGSWK